MSEFSIPAGYDGDALGVRKERNHPSFLGALGTANGPLHRQLQSSVKMLGKARMGFFDVAV